MKKLLFLIIFLVTLIACTSSSYNNKRVRGDVYSLYIDTLNVHGHKHEFLTDHNGYRTYAVCHSPECWCYKR